MLEEYAQGICKYNAILRKGAVAPEAFGVHPTQFPVDECDLYTLKVFSNSLLKKYRQTKPQNQPRCCSCGW